MSNLDTLSDGRSADVAVKEIRNHISRLDAEYAGLNNAAAMREALEAMLDECCNLCDVPNQMSESGHTCSWRNRWSGCQSKAIDKARAALSAPARNCDRYRTEAEAEAAFDRFCLKTRTGECKPWECPLKSTGGKYCYVAWLLGTEGGAE